MGCSGNIIYYNILHILYYTVVVFFFFYNILYVLAISYSGGDHHCEALLEASPSIVLGQKRTIINFYYESMNRYY